MFFNFKKKKENKESTEIVLTGSEENFVIPVEKMELSEIPDPCVLIEITDSKVLGHVDALIPGLVQAGNAASNAAVAANIDGTTLYRAIIPSGATLANSKAVPGTYRGFYYGADGIGGHANLVEETVTTGTGVRMNTVASAMAVASMVVGQYYMRQINSTLHELNGEIAKITGFQNNEYKSKVLSLMQHVMGISLFQTEIIENDEARLLRIDQLNALEMECTELLGQAGFMIDDLIKENKLDYGAYEKKMAEIQHWYDYQNALYIILYKVSELKYTLYLGGISREQCTTLLPEYEAQMEATRKKRSAWHKQMMQRLDVDARNGRRKKQGVSGALFLIPGIINEDLKFKSISTSTAAMINSQSVPKPGFTHDVSDLYSKEVKLFARDGKLYYMPET